jgi:membrane fusion protein, copper/silver efflux system
MNAGPVVRLISACLTCALLLQNALASGDPGERKILYWTDPMLPDYRSDGPGKSPMGMELVPVYADTQSANDAGTVTIAPEIVQNLGVRTARAERSRLRRGVDTVGYVDYDESRLAHVHLRTEGWIEHLVFKSEGERVRRGDRLFDLYSPELVNAQDEFIQALKAGNPALVQASRDRLEALGISAGQINQLQKDRRVRQPVSFYAPQDGVISSLPVREGMYVKPEDTVMSLADLSSVWLLADVFERQADWIRVGQSAEVQLSYLPGHQWEGRVEYIYPSLDPVTRTLKARLRFENPGEVLKPNMYAKVKIFGEPREDIVVIPVEALIRTGREQRVVVALGEGRFASRKVTAGIESDDRVEIVEGIEAGEEVVISGQFLIDSEASLRANDMRMTPPGDASANPSPAQTGIHGTGRLLAVDPVSGKVSLSHDPIPVLGWPAMQMDFTLADGVASQGLSSGDRVRFTLEKHDDGYRITAIQKDAGAAP